MGNVKSWLTDVLAVGILVFTAMQTYFSALCEGCAIDWFVLIIGVVTAVVSFFTGRNGDGSKKTTPARN